MGSVRFRRVAALGLVLLALLAPCAQGRSKEPTVEELKARVETVNRGDRPALCIHISERQLAAAGKSYDAGDDQKDRRRGVEPPRHHGDDHQHGE